MSCECKCKCFTKRAPIKELCALSNCVQMPTLMSSVWGLPQQRGVWFLSLSVSYNMRKRHLFSREERRLFNVWTPSHPYVPRGPLPTPCRLGLSHGESHSFGHVQFNLRAQCPQSWTGLKTENIYCFSVTSWWWEIVSTTGKFWCHLMSSAPDFVLNSYSPQLTFSLLNFKTVCPLFSLKQGSASVQTSIKTQSPLPCLQDTGLCQIFQLW